MHYKFCYLNAQKLQNPKANPADLISHINKRNNKNYMIKRQLRTKMQLCTPLNEKIQYKPIKKSDILNCELKQSLFWTTLVPQPLYWGLNSGPQAWQAKTLLLSYILSSRNWLITDFSTSFFFFFKSFSLRFFSTNLEYILLLSVRICQRFRHFVISLQT